MGRGVKRWPNVAVQQLLSRKKVQLKYREIACKATFSHTTYLRQAAKIYVATSYSMVRPETIEISQQKAALYDFVHKRSTDV